MTSEGLAQFFSTFLQDKNIRCQFIAQFYTKNAYKETHSESILPPSADLFSDT